MDLGVDLRRRIADELDCLVAFRRDLHRHPELSDAEHRTSALVQQALQQAGILCRAGFGRAGTGVLAWLPATRHSPTTVGLRADMDALPIRERADRPHRSVHEGIMHACGHDGHTAILVGAARVLAACPARPNHVTFVFQPAEEHGGGAAALIDQGALGGQARGGLGTPVSRLFGLHAWPDLPLGAIATRPGPIFAANDDFTLTFHGIGGHAAFPQHARNPIPAVAAAALAIADFQRTFPRVVCTTTRVAAGTASNVIPACADLGGTLRTLDPDDRRLAIEALERLAHDAARAHACRARLLWEPGYPPTVNDPTQADRVLDLAARAFGADRARCLEHPLFTAEDFAWYTQVVPACFFLLGLASPGGPYPALHQDDFDFNDQALPFGVEIMCRLALDPGP